MHYLGGLRGAGILTCDGRTPVRAEYDFEGFLVRPGQVISSGEIRMAPKVLRELFVRKTLQLLTDDGRRLSIRFSEKDLPAASDTAHVEVAGELPLASEWRH